MKEEEKRTNNQGEEFTEITDQEIAKLYLEGFDILADFLFLAKKIKEKNI